MAAPAASATPARTVSNLNPANAITASRFFTLPVFGWALGRGEVQMAILAVAVCAVLDVLDGFVARVFGYQTPFGEVFDGLADGMCYAFFLAAVVWFDRAPFAPVAIIIAIGLINLAMRVAYAKRLGRTANYRSFAMERLVGFAAFLAPLAVVGWSVSYYFWSYAVINVVVVLHDAKRMLIDPVPAVAESLAP